jgi:hypothetical protein
MPMLFGFSLCCLSAWLVNIGNIGSDLFSRVTMFAVRFSQKSNGLESWQKPSKIGEKNQDDNRCHPREERPRPTASGCRFREVIDPLNDCLEYIGKPAGRGIFIPDAPADKDDDQDQQDIDKKCSQQGIRDRKWLSGYVEQRRSERFAWDQDSWGDRFKDARKYEN